MIWVAATVRGRDRRGIGEHRLGLRREVLLYVAYLQRRVRQRGEVARHRLRIADQQQIAGSCLGRRGPGERQHPDGARRSDGDILDPVLEAACGRLEQRLETEPLQAAVRNNVDLRARHDHSRRGLQQHGVQRRPGRVSRLQRIERSLDGALILIDQRLNRAGTGKLEQPCLARGDDPQIRPARAK